jgi:hypothetical protein
MSARTDPSRPRKSSSASEQTDPDLHIDRQMQDTLNDVIAKQVVQSLGSPSDLLKVQVRPLGRDCYRVNVFVGKYGGNARIADSFFLTADDQGKILTSSPEIARLY